MKTFQITLFLFLLSFSIRAQQPWRFHLAFEDATGAKDTIWLVWDTTAHTNLPVDTALGEGHVKLNLNDFNVFVGNSENDTTKTTAFPYSIYPIMETGIAAINYNYPIQITWDSSLFHASYLPTQATIPAACINNEYFFFTSPDPCSCFNLLFEDNVELPHYSWGSQDHFPLFISFDCSGENIKSIESDNKISLFPNPVSDKFSIASEYPIKEILITDVLGNTIYNNDLKNINQLKKIEAIDVSVIPKGIYLIKIKSFNNQAYIEKFIKIH